MGCLWWFTADYSYLVRRFPRAFGFLVVVASLNPVLLCCKSWLALVLGRRGEGFPAPGRTGAPARALLWDALRMRIPMQQYKLALTAHILMASPNHRGILELETWNTHTLIQEYARGHSYHDNSRLREGDTRFKLEL